MVTVYKYKQFKIGQKSKERKPKFNGEIHGMLGAVSYRVGK